MQPKKKDEPDIAPESDRPRLDDVPRVAGLDAGSAATMPFAGGALSALAGNWWLVLLRGALAVLFGVLCFVWPALSVVMLVFLFGAYAFADGAMAIGTALSPAGTGRIGSLVVLGILGLIAGIVAFLWPGITAMAVLLLIGVWAIMKGVLEIATATRLRREIEGEWMAVLAGVISVLFGVILLASPRAGAVAIIWLIGAYAIVFGIVTVALAFRLRARKQEHAATA